MMRAVTDRAERRTERATEAKTRLDRESILEAGLRVASRPGATSIPVRDLGADLGVDPTAIYRHFRSKESLMQALLDRLFAMSLAELSAPAEDWKGRLGQLAESTLELFTQYPAIGVEAIVISTNGPAELEIVELMLDAFSRAGLSDNEVVRHYALYSEHLLSSAAGIARAHAERTDLEDDSSPWIDSPLLVDPERYPHIAALSPQLRALDSRDLLRLGAESIINSAERTAADAAPSLAPTPVVE